MELFEGAITRLAVPNSGTVLADLAGFYDDMVRIDRSFTYLAEIVNSVRGSEAADYESLTGHDDKIGRPVDDAALLWWRFLLEKWDVKSARLGIRTWASGNALSCR